MNILTHLNSLKSIKPLGQVKNKTNVNLKSLSLKRCCRNVCDVSNERVKTYSRTSLLNCSLLLPKNSPIICLLRPFLCSRKCATPMAVSGTKPRVIRKWMPRSGFLPVDNKHHISHRCWELSNGYNVFCASNRKGVWAGVRK